jgi:predicted nucleic acid-binding protein
LRPVLDASVFVAAISPTERHHRDARQLFDSHPDTEPYLVPGLFRVEVLAALARRGESAELLDTVDALVLGPRFYVCSLDEALLVRAGQVARAARLRAYDAVYVALALERGVPLFTLDREVVLRCREVFPEFGVVAGAV